jgi:hypothetical protein
MNKERELLLLALDYLCTIGWGEADRFAIVALAENIRELLAQPEQDPVDWEKEKKSYLDEIDRLGVESNRDEEEIDRLTQLLTPTDQKPVAWMYDYDGTTWVKLKEPDLPNMHHSVKNIRPLYTAPPKPKPMSDGEITKNTANNIPIGEKLAFHAGIRWAEHQHGIGE